MMSLTTSFLSWEPDASELSPRCITLSTITSNTNGSSKNFWVMSSKCLLSRAIPRATLGFPPERTFPYSAIHSFTSLYLVLAKVSSICWPIVLPPLCTPLNSKHGRYTPSSFCKTLAMMPNSKLFIPFFTNTKLRSLNAAQLCFNPTPLNQKVENTNWTTINVEIQLPLYLVYDQLNSLFTNRIRSRIRFGRDEQLQHFFQRSNFLRIISNAQTRGIGLPRHHFVQIAIDLNPACKLVFFSFHSGIHGIIY
mmetsp:Transcript_9466/g.19953  ORF Transcript_9466/g.19953 Transcript_9466/m.19953 type:complete len:251 (+) Transcript_9466:394-1146(+)